MPDEEEGRRGPSSPEFVLVLPLGGLPADTARSLAAALSRRVALPCRVGPVPGGPDPPPLPGRPQVDADALLAGLEAIPAPPGALLLGATSRDLGHPLFTYFFGRARRGGRAAVVSLARLSPAAYGLPDDPALTLRRAVAEAVHELGHLAGLRHCVLPRCVMRFAATVEAADLRGGAFCPACTRDLPPFLRPAARAAR